MQDEKNLSESLLQVSPRFYRRLPPPLYNVRNVYGLLTGIYSLSLSLSLSDTRSMYLSVHMAKLSRVAQRSSRECIRASSLELREKERERGGGEVGRRFRKGDVCARRRCRAGLFRIFFLAKHGGWGCKLHVRDERATKGGRARQPRSVLCAAPRLSRGQEA